MIEMAFAAGTEARARRTIMVVEDDGDVREAVVSALDEEGYTTVEASDGSAALATLETMEPPDLIVLDLTMPRMEGPEFRRALAKHPDFANVPVVVMSADVEGRAKAKRMGANAFLRKPVRLHELFGIVAEALSRSLARREPKDD